MREWLPAGRHDGTPRSEISRAFERLPGMSARLPARSLLNAYFGCLLSTECARQAFLQRARVFWAHERGRHSLSDVNGEIQEVGDKVTG
jgi:hypothetical protein